MATASDFAVNDEYTVGVSESLRGRKRKRSVETWAKTKNKSAKYRRDNKNPEISCHHNKKTYCKANELEEADIKRYQKRLYDYGSKAEQDKFLIKAININKPARRRNRIPGSTRRRPMSLTYTLHMKNGTSFRVCADTFRSITGVTRRRINLLCYRFQSTGDMPRERRGGSRIKPADIEVRDSIIEWIKKYKCRESHYGRSKSTRHYLPPELNIVRIYKSWRDTRTSENKKTASLTKFKGIFCSRFNLGFGNPRQDVCSFCEVMKSDVKHENNETKKRSLTTQLQLHKLRAVKFHQIMKERPEKSVSVCFDMQQNQPLPKIQVTEVFYSRQIWLYNLTFVKLGETQTRDDIKVYTWLESESGRGANEVCSALMHYLRGLEQEIKDSESDNKPQTLRLFSDACSSQNKNSILIGALSHFQKNSIFDKIEHYFPICGHSYMPADRVFGRIEKNLRKHENIVSPSEYYTIFSKHGHVRVLEDDWEMYDYQGVAKNKLKVKLPFKIREQRVFTYSDNGMSVQNVYSGNQLSAPRY